MPRDFQYLAVVTFIKEGGWQQSGLLGRGTFLENCGINSSSQTAGGGAYLWLPEEETPGCPVSGHGDVGVPWHPGGAAGSPACWPFRSWRQGTVCTPLSAVPAKGHIIYLFVSFPVVLPNFTSSSESLAFLLYFSSLPRVWSIYGCWVVSGKARMGN